MRIALRPLSTRCYFSPLPANISAARQLVSCITLRLYEAAHRFPIPVSPYITYVSYIRYVSQYIRWVSPYIRPVSGYIYDQAAVAHPGRLSLSSAGKQPGWVKHIALQADSIQTLNKKILGKLGLNSQASWPNCPPGLSYCIIA